MNSLQFIDLMLAQKVFCANLNTLLEYRISFKNDELQKYIHENGYFALCKINSFDSNDGWIDESSEFRNLLLGKVSLNEQKNYSKTN